MSYESGFAAGERQSYIDRKEGNTKAPQREIKSQFDAGYLDGYYARSSYWAGESVCRKQTFHSIGKLEINK